MKQTASRFNWVTATALVLALPTAYFIAINLLKEGLGVNGPYDAANPLLERVGIKESLGWNINLLILFGPILAIVLTVFQVLKFHFYFTKQDFQFSLSVQKRWFQLLVGAFSAGLLAILFFYMLGENCIC